MSPYIAYPVSFDGIDLTSITGLTVLKTDPYRPPRRNVEMAELARRSQNKLSSAFYREKRITVRVGITRATRALAEVSLDSLYAILQRTDRPLIVPYGGSRRKFTATYEDSVFDDEKEGGSYVEKDLVFTCSDVFGYDLAETLLLQITNYTSHYRSDKLTFGGSAPTQAPYIVLTYSVVTTGTNRTVQIGNSDTGQQVAITGTWVAGDKIEVDCLNGSVKVNGIEVDFVGAIPDWEVGFGWWYYNDNFHARTFSGQIRHARRYV